MTEGRVEIVDINFQLGTLIACAYRHHYKWKFKE